LRLAPELQVHHRHLRQRLNRPTEDSPSQGVTGRDNEHTVDGALDGLTTHVRHDRNLDPRAEALDLQQLPTGLTTPVEVRLEVFGDAALHSLAVLLVPPTRIRLALSLATRSLDLSVAPDPLVVVRDSPVKLPRERSRTRLVGHLPEVPLLRQAVGCGTAQSHPPC